MTQIRYYLNCSTRADLFFFIISFNNATFTACSEHSTLGMAPATIMSIACATILFVSCRCSYYSLQADGRYNRQAKRRKPDKTRAEYCDSGCVCYVSSPMTRNNSLTSRLPLRQPRPVPSPAFNQESRRNDVQPLQNAKLPEMDES